MKKTLEELANFFGMAIAKDADGEFFAYACKPELGARSWLGGGEAFEINEELVDYDGSWQLSLTLPDSWIKEAPFKVGELVIGITGGVLAKWGESAHNPDLWRRPTRAQWKTLRGEE